MTTNEQSDDLRQQTALFRFSVLGDLVHREPGEPGLYENLRERAERTYDIPGSRRSRIAVETIRGWLRDYRRGGFEALRPHPRNDIGVSRTITQDIADHLCTLKEETPELSLDQVIARFRAATGTPDSVLLPRSTVHRLLQRRGLMDRPIPTTGDPNDRRRFTFDKAGALWMSDVMHGPSVSAEKGRKRKTYLIATIDDATRVIPYCAFALSENTTAFLSVLRQAIIRRGIPERLYVDNGAAYRSRYLSLVCAKLGITLIHARPYQPQGKGKMERWFRTVRQSFLAQVGSSALDSLDTLNRELWAFVEREYHQSPHRGLNNQTPYDVWAQLSSAVRLPSESLDLDDLFLLEEKRKVSRDRIVSLRGVPYEVDANLVGQTVSLRFNPEKRTAPVKIIHNGKLVQLAKPVDAYANCFVKRDHGTKLLAPEQSPQFPAGLRLRDFNSTKEK
ncbi:MAG: transposase [Nitrospiraceae bacterium]|nr:transposase [Nitrospiraceae bacterium]